MATDELDIFADTTNEATGLEDTTSISEIEQAFPADNTDQYGGMIDAEATFTDASQYLGVSKEQWFAFVEEVNDIKAQMNAFEGNAARVMQERSIPNAVLDRRIAVLMNQNPGMTAEEARAQVESNPEYQQMVETNEQYEALNARLNKLYESVGLNSQGSITGSDKSIEGGEVRFDLDTGAIEFVEIGSKFGAGIVLMAAAAVFSGPLATALGPASAGGAGIFSSAAAANAASAAIISSASQLAATGKLDIGKALVSAAISYGGAQLGDVIKSSSAVGDIVSQIQSTTDAAVDFLSQGNSLAEAAIRAGGMSMLTQLVTTGEVDMTEAAIAAVISGGAEAVQQLATASGQPVDEFMADLQKQDEFVQAAIDADIKDPFLNPNYTTVGDGLMVNPAGDVFNYAGDNLGNMSTLDTNNDGKLSGVDLQEIEVTATRVSIYDNLDPTSRHYVDAEGNIRTDVRAGDYGKYYASDGTEVFEARYDNGKLLVADESGSFNTIRNVDGSVYGTYNPETGEWVGADGKTLDSSVGEYMATKSGVLGPSQIDTGMTKTEYGQMSGAELFDDYFVQRGGDGQLTLGDTEMQELVNRFGSGEAFEEWLQENNYGVNYSAGTGYVFEANVDTSEGIYGFMGDDSTIASLFDADELSDTQYSSVQYVTPKTQVTAPWVEPEPVDPTKVTDVTDVTKTTQSGGQEVADSTANAIATATNTNQINETIASAGQQGASASQLTNAINAAVAAGTISAEQAAAALGAIDVTASVDQSTTSVSTGAGGMLTSGNVTNNTGGDGVTTGDVTTTGGDGVTTGTGGDGVTTGTGGDGVTTGSGNAGTKTYSTAVTGALGGAITTIAGTGDPGTGDPGTGDPGTGGPETGGPPGIEVPTGKDGKDGVSSRPFTPYEFKGFSYQTPTIQEIVQNPNIDYTASLDRIINKGMFGNLI
jgi:hypothetical protein